MGADAYFFIFKTRFRVKSCIRGGLFVSLPGYII